MEDVDHLTLLNLFHRCAHQLHHIRKNCGQGRILILLNEKGTLTQRELIELTGRRSATLSEQLDCMDKANLITREKNAADKRTVDVRLTAAGKEAAIEAAQKRLKNADMLFGSLNPAEKRQLLKLLTKLQEHWSTLPEEEREESLS